MTAEPLQTGPAPPGRWSFLRDTRFLQALAQVRLSSSWLPLSSAGSSATCSPPSRSAGSVSAFDFFKRTAGFGIGEGLPFERTDTFWRAYVVGLVNSFRVISFGLVLATILGILAGVALLSPNWLLRNIVSAYVEVMRNTPLLVQLFFIYFGIILKLPSLEDRILIGPFSLSNRGFYFPRLVPQKGFPIWISLSVIGLIIGVVVYQALCSGAS